MSGSARSIRTRTGTVLISSPTMSSTPGSSGARPLTMAPKTTSSLRTRWPSSTAQAPWSMTLGVSRRPRASSVRRAVAASDSSVSTRSGSTPPGPGAAGAVRVPPLSPDSAFAHASRAASRSRPSSQVRKDR